MKLLDLTVFVGLREEGLEHHAHVVAEVESLEYPAGEPVRAVVEKRQPIRAGAPGAALELVELVAGLASEQLGEPAVAMNIG